MYAVHGYLVGQSAVLAMRQLLPVFPDRQTFSVFVGIVSKAKRESPLDHKRGGRHSGLPILDCACAVGTENSTQGFFVQAEPLDHLITLGA